MQAVVDCGALDSLVTCLEEFDPGVKEAASWTLGYVASHSPELAQQVPTCPQTAALQHSLLCSKQDARLGIARPVGMPKSHCNSVKISGCMQALNSKHTHSSAAIVMKRMCDVIDNVLDLRDVLAWVCIHAYLICGAADLRWRLQHAACMALHTYHTAAMCSPLNMLECPDCSVRQS